MLPSIPTSSAWLVALLKQLVENESGKFPGVYSCPFNLHLTNPPQVREPTCGVRSSGSRGSTNTAVQIWHTGFLISYLLAGQAAVSFQGRITHYCLVGKEQGRGKKKKGKSFNGLSNLPSCCPNLLIVRCYKLLVHYCVHKALLGCVIIVGPYGIL